MSKILPLLEMAILANTSRPTPEEEKKTKVKKRIMTSLKKEGDSKLGMILFVGIAHKLKVRASEVRDYLGIEFRREYNHKLSEFNRLNESDERFKNKVKIIGNYIKFNS